ncbi:MAG: ferrous iron transport protein A [Erysipelothrix sp.]|jgi:ferrous iron transport protein A|nr:ferrous iron transport protein A [Erysipelothrix sp.]
MKTLNDVKLQKLYVVKGLGKKSLIRKRIIDMGVTIGTPIKVIKQAPLGDPIEIFLRGYHLTLRKNEAKEIFVEECP